MEEKDIEQKLLAVAAHLGYMGGGIGIIIVPLCIWIFKRNDAFVAHHAKQAFFTQLLGSIIVILGTIVGVIIVEPDSDEMWSLIPVVPILIWLPFWVVSSLYATIKVLNSEYFYSPLLYVFGMRKPRS